MAPLSLARGALRRLPQLSRTASPQPAPGGPHRLTVVNVERLTADSVAITFGVPPMLRETYRFSAGQHIAIEDVVGGRKVRRCYSICASESSQQLRIGVKKVQGGAVSARIVDTFAVGTRASVIPPAGRFTTPLDPRNALHYAAVAGGSGITPVLSIMSSVLETEPASLFSLIYANRDRQSMMFADEIADLEATCGRRLRVYHVLESDNERVQRTHLAAINVPTPPDQWFLCGPEPMTAAVRENLDNLGVDAGAVHLEVFSGATRATVSPQIARPPAGTEAVGQVAVRLLGQTSTVPSTADETVLAAVLKSGLDAPWSCQQGFCGMCRARVEDGQCSEMPANEILTEDELSQGYVLTCQVSRVSARLRVDYDN
ncbi:MAG: 2Fe-2S iron-sulfur cluster-binding protein [Nocardiaceae bacterium]|nr:2Fe-2S iron-sulfur cluster-binding protein [Nocardiaceae bacterium]